MSYLKNSGVLGQNSFRVFTKNSLGKCYFFSENFIFKEGGGENPVMDTILKVAFDVKALQI